MVKKSVEIKRIDLMPLGKTIGIIYAAIGLITGLFFLYVSLTNSDFIQQGGDVGVIFSTLGNFGFIVFPIMYGILGFIFGIFIGWVYNLSAKKFGGIKFELN